MGKRSLARASVVEVSKEEIRDPHLQSRLPAPGDPAPFYAAALLKLAVELRRPEPRSLDEMIERILEDTPIDREAFRGYLQRNFSLLRRS